VRERLLSACELAERSESNEVRQRCFTTVIIGGGATGVELACAVAELSRRPASANPTTYGNCCSSF
jgi:NADH dehydrogenase